MNKLPKFNLKKRRYEGESTHISNDLMRKWQRIINIIPNFVDVPVALIMKVDDPYIEVLIASENKSNPYNPGDKEHLRGLYCEKVINTRNQLLVANAVEEGWKKNSDIEMGLISYLGFPILYPDGNVFGTICVLDTKQNQYNNEIKELMINFKDIIEDDLYFSLIQEDFFETKEDLEVLFNNSTSGIAYHKIIYDKKGNAIDYKITKVNSKYEEILSLKDYNVIEKKATEIYKVKKPPYLDIYSKVASELKSISFETYFRPMDRYFKISVISNRIGEFITIFDDISRRKNSQKKLKESENNYKRAFEQASFYKDLFTHDISNIIQIIHTAAEMHYQSISESRESQEANDTLGMILKNANKAIELIKNVRKYSKIEESLTDPLYKIKIMPILNMAIENNKIAFEKKDITITIKSELKEMSVLANDLLLDAFENILNNAIVYNDSEKIEIIIRISEELEESKDFIKFEFLDNGNGIKDENKKKIFERGYDAIKGGKGMGIGLSLIRNLLDRFNGKIWVENRIDNDYTKGSNFIILLPKI
ncbi:MAG: hypothetical protein GF329_04430 [Candidatus Lokiarchaeota archaeon]|nr:hypothetical protein [Candidatus Lokiarchaeota archaeon]